MKKFAMYLGAVAMLGTTFMSCNSDDDNGKKVNEKTVYEFSRDGKSSVNYEGQNTRLMMVGEIVDALGDPTKTKNQIEDMYAHQQGGQDFSNKDLNESGKNVKSKVAASVGLFKGQALVSNQIKEKFSEFIAIQTEQVFPNWDNPASAGQAGQIAFVSGNDTKIRHFDGRGIEPNQLVKKGLIGGLQLDQSLNHYLVRVVEDENDVLAPESNYTTMEHHWDEAFGYLFGGSSEVVKMDSEGKYPATNEFAKYANVVSQNPHFKDIAKEIYQAFVDGRQAIVDKDYTKRNEMIKVIQKKASTVVAVRGVYYLLEGAEKVKAGTPTLGFHGLSEGLGFLYSLQFTANPDTLKPYFTHDEVNEMFNKITSEDHNGLWNVTEAQINEVAKQVADRFGFTLEQAKSAPVKH